MTEVILPNVFYRRQSRQYTYSDIRPNYPCTFYRPFPSGFKLILRICFYDINRLETSSTKFRAQEKVKSEYRACLVDNVEFLTKNSFVMFRLWNGTL